MKTKNFWKNKKVFITGHTGFKGSWLTLLLNRLGASIYGYALDPISKPNFFDGLNLSKYLKKDYRKDVNDFKALRKAIKSCKPSIVFHLAAQSSVLVSYDKSIKTVKTNVIGTANILEIIKLERNIKSAIIVTTDKVYLNLENKTKFKENSRLGGYDLYSASKAASEIISEGYIKSFYQKNKCNIATVRSGNCIGGGDWTEDRIIKDCVNAFRKNKTLTLRSPNATRPWQHVLEPLLGYLKLAENLYKEKGKKFVGAWNFGPNTKNNLKVKQLAEYGKKIFQSKSKIKIVKKRFYESENLSLDSSKSKKYLGWGINLNAYEALNMTFEWFKLYHKNKKDLITLSLMQISTLLKKTKF